MIPGEILTEEGEHLLNIGRRTLTLVVTNASERPIQVGSHYHFAETNAALNFDRAAAQGMRLNIASGLGSAPSNWWTTPATVWCSVFAA